MTVRIAKREDIERFGGIVHACKRHTAAGWQESCDDCGYSFPDHPSMKAYHDFCNFGPTVYDIVPAKDGKNPIDGSPA